MMGDTADLIAALPTDRVLYECPGCHEVIDIITSRPEADALSTRWMNDHEGCHEDNIELTDEEVEKAGGGPVDQYREWLYDVKET